MVDHTMRADGGAAFPFSAVGGTCAGSQDWDLDTGGLQEWVSAMTRCHGCPLMRQCRAELDETYPGWWQREKTGGPLNPAGVIWAGWAFSDSGTVLTERGLRRVAAQRRIGGLDDAALRPAS